MKRWGAALALLFAMVHGLAMVLSAADAPPTKAAPAVKDPKAAKTDTKTDAPKADTPKKDAPAKPPTQEQIDKALAALVENPTKESYIAARALVMAHPSYRPASDVLSAAGSLLEEKKYDEARELLGDAMPGLALSPKGHELAAKAARALKDEAAAKRHEQQAAGCLKALLAIGDGSKKAPYLVTRVSDEYDIARGLKLRVFGQQVRAEGGRSYHVLSCTGDKELWFDITDVLPRMFKKAS